MNVDRLQSLLSSSPSSLNPSHILRVLVVALLLAVAGFGLTACGDSEGALDMAGDMGGAGPGAPGGGGSSVEGVAGLMTAGEWRDLDHWSFWRELVDPNRAGSLAELERRWGFDTAARHSVLVLDGRGEPAVDVPVKLLAADERVLWEARTDAYGHAELFAGLFGGEVPTEGLRLVAEAGGQAVSLSADERVPGERAVLNLEVEEVEVAPALDVMFVVDTTGSMGDELSYLQTELGDVITRVRQDNSGELAVRLSVNFYRDKGDAYVVRSNPFSTELDEVLPQLASEFAAGGGDYPEAVELGLADGVMEHRWSESARARLLFLVLDAPPHHNAETLERLSALTAEAARQGIRLIPIAASGVDRDTEVLVRLLDVSTGGTYVFLTDDSGIGGEHLEPSVGEFEVEPLNELLVRLINEAVAFAPGQEAGQ